MKIQFLLVLLIVAILAVHNVYADTNAAGAAAGSATPDTKDNKGDEGKENFDDEKIFEELFDDEDFAPPQLSETELKEVLTWPGHLKPLGTGNEKIPVSEIKEFPNPKDFYTEYVIKSQPVIIRGGAASQVAKGKWTDAYLKSLPNADKLRVYVENSRKEDRTQSAIELPNLPFVTEWVNEYATADKFMISDTLNALKPDYVLPQSLQCDAIKPLMMRALVHMNGGNTKSVLHHEHYEDIHCVLDGERNYLLANPATNAEHLFIDADDEETGEYVALDVDSVDATKYPNMRKVVFYQGTVKAGDCIYIPSAWMQADTTSNGRQLSVSTWWARDDTTDDAVSNGKCVTTGEWSLDKLQFLDEVSILMMTDEERKAYMEAKEKEEAALDAAEEAALDAELNEANKAEEAPAAAKPTKDEL